MKKEKCNFCPGCKRACPSCCPRCKYGVKYFSKNAANEENPKWARHISVNGPAYQLLSISRSAKKALCKEKITEDALFEKFSADDRQIFSELLAKLARKLAESK